MTKLFLLFLYCGMAFTICHGQAIKTNSPVTNQLTNNGNFVSVLDVDGKPFKIYEADVQGHVFLTDIWQAGNIQLSNGTVAKNIMIKLNLYNNYLHFLNDKGLEMYKEAYEIKNIEIMDLIKKDSVVQVFKTYEVEKNGRKATCFYEKLTGGNISLLKVVGKKIVTSTNEFNKEVTKEYVFFDGYFVHKNNEIKELKRKESFFEELMNDKWQLINKFINQNDFNFKTIVDIREIISYYNKS